MYLRKLFLFTFLFVCFISSCKDQDPLSPLNPENNEETLFKNGKNKCSVKVMTRNVYVGADVDEIMRTDDQNQIPFVVADVYQSMLATNFPERAQALAHEIFEQQPHLIGLQEISLLRMQSPGDIMIGGSEPAENIVLDYLEILLEAMRAMGLEYEVVAKIENVDVEMPMIVTLEEPYEFNDVRLTDYDVILAKSGIPISKVEERNFKAKVSIPEMGIEIPRGYTAVTAKIDNQKFRFVNTHLEDASQGGDLLKIQLAQAAELLLKLARVRIPVIMVGDFNSTALTGETYRLVTLTKRFQDTWLDNKLVDNLDGFTYGHDLSLLNEEQNFWERIDYIFVRNGKCFNKNIKLKDVVAEVLGDEESDKTVSDLWPSDHGGVAAQLNFKISKKR